MTQDDRLEEITKQLHEISIYHQRTGEAIKKIHQEVASIIKDSNKKRAKTPIVAETPVTTEECRGLIGRTVRIINPGRGEVGTGIIESVGKLYITIILPNGTKKLRIAKNIRLLHHEP